jgi:tetratricopeptide (TPR) repeat protein
VNGLLAAELVGAMESAGIVQPRGDWQAACFSEAQRRIAAQLVPADHATAHRMVAKVYSWAGKLEEAGPAALAALAIAPQDRECLFIAGAYYRFLGKDRQAADYFRQALEIEIAQNPDDAQARCFLADALAELGKWEAARERYQQSLELDAESAAAHRGLAKVLVELGDAAEARNHLREALRLDPHDEESARLLREE